MKTCKKLNPNGTCPELKRDDPFKLGGKCNFCRNDIAEICDKYQKVN
jgi:hypothetical protein